MRFSWAGCPSAGLPRVLLAALLTVLLAGAFAAGLLGLQSPQLLVLLAVALVGSVLLLARAGRQAPVGLLGTCRRTVAVLGCQLLAVLLVADAVNSWFDFYSSWDDLFGTGNGTLVLHDPGAGTGSAVRRVDRLYAAPDPRRGRLVSLTVPGSRTGLRDAVDVYLPPQYDEPAYAHRRFPAALVLSGYPGTVGGLEHSIGFTGAMDTLLHEGRVVPTVLVLSASAVQPPRDTECTDVPGGPQVETYFAQDLPEGIARRYRVDGPGRWGVIGVSTGGFCAAKLVLRHPEVFRVAVSISGYLEAGTDATTGDLFGGSRQLRHENSPLWRVAHLPLPRAALMLTASRQERGVYPQLVRFLQLAHPPLEVASVVRPTGGHNGRVWRSELPVCLQWLGSRMPEPA